MAPIPVVPGSGRAGARPAGARRVLRYALAARRRRLARRQRHELTRAWRRRPRLERAGLALACWIGLALLLALDRRLAPALELTRADFGTTAAIAVISFLGGLFRLFGGGVSKEVKRALEGMRGIIVSIGREIAEFARDSAVIFSSVWSFIRKYWERVLLPMLRRLDGYLIRFVKWLRDTFGPILEFLQSVRKWILDFYAKWLGPIFDTIDVFRRILSVFSLFGLEWSRRLDAKLAALQDLLMRPLERVMLEINNIIGQIDRVLTGNGLFQRLTLLRSIERDIAYIWRAHRNAQSAPLTPEQRAAAAAAGNWKSGDTVIAETRGYLRTGDGPNATSIAEYVRDLELRLRRAS